MHRTIIGAVILITTMLMPVRAEEPHPFTVHEMLAIDRISDPQVSPDGKQVVFVLRVTDLEANKGRTDLWRVNVDGSNLRQLTTHPAGDSSPRWSPDGNSVYFLSTRSDSSQIWKIAVSGGEAEQVSKSPLDIGSFNLSPDGKQLACSIEVFPGSTLEETVKKLDEQKKKKNSGVIYDALLFRHWDTWSDGRRSHVFVMPSTGGALVDVMKDMKADCPSKPFGGPEEYTFTPNNVSVVFTARDAGREEAWSTNLDIFVSPIDGQTPPKCLTSSNKATDTFPAFSPNGKTLAYLAMEKAGYEADRQRIMLLDWATKESKTLTQDWDRSASDILWSADGKTLYATADHLGQHSLFAISTVDGSAQVIVKEGTVSSPGIASDRIVYALDTLMNPVELFSVKLDGSDMNPITQINAKRLESVALGDFAQFSFPGWKGETVYGYMVRPANFDPEKKYPVAFLIHGGPQGSFGNHFHYRWNPQTYAGAGYAAVMIDFHGSTGYGQAFCDAIRGDWGGKPLEDLKKGLEFALQQYPWMDGDHVAALGASYGGYMINWIAGHWPDRFKCLVAHDGNLDEHFAYFATEELWFPEWDQLGTPWENPKGYEKHNPINFVQNWKTPTLVIHGGLDFRVVETGGMATFTALQRRGIPSKFLYFPDENHWVLKPANSILWHDTVIDWLNQWTKPSEKPAAQ